jgi:hypothetical protein
MTFFIHLTLKFVAEAFVFCVVFRISLFNLVLNQCLSVFLRFTTWLPLWHIQRFPVDLLICITPGNCNNLINWIIISVITPFDFNRKQRYILNLDSVFSSITSLKIKNPIHLLWLPLCLFSLRSLIAFCIRVTSLKYLLPSMNFAWPLWRQGQVVYKHSLQMWKIIYLWI